MTTMIAEVYDALIEAGASEEKAKKAAEAIASYDDRFNRVDVKLEKIDGNVRLLKWMIGLVIAGIIALIVKTYFPV